MLRGQMRFEAETNITRLRHIATCLVFSSIQNARRACYCAATLGRNNDRDDFEDSDSNLLFSKGQPRPTPHHLVAICHRGSPQLSITERKVRQKKIEESGAERTRRIESGKSPIASSNETTLRTVILLLTLDANVLVLTTFFATRAVVEQPASAVLDGQALRRVRSKSRS